jgi:hypothetical protein
LGGIVIATSGVAWVYLANAISFSAVVAALLMMRNLPQRQPTESGARREDVSFRAALEGLRFVFRSPLIRRRCCSISSRRSFRRRPRCCRSSRRTSCGRRDGYGWLYAAPAAGAVATSAVMVPMTERIERRGPTLLWAVVGYGSPPWSSACRDRSG